MGLTEPGVSWVAKGVPDSEDVLSQARGVRTAPGPSDPLRLTGLRNVELAGTSFATGSLHDVADELIAAAVEGRGTSVRLVNTNSLGLARSHSGYEEVLTGAGINLPDGTPVRWLLRLKSGAAVPPLRGPDVFRAVLDRGRDRGVRHFLLGGLPGDEPRLREAITASYPGCNIVGSAAPPFRPLTPDERDAQDELIRESRPHIIWVGLGGAKQDIEAQRLAEGLGLLCVGVGAAFDFVSGVKPEAPNWIRGSGLEWLHRLMSEPRRLWRRYLVDSVSAVRWLRR